MTPINIYPNVPKFTSVIFKHNSRYKCIMNEEINVLFDAMCHEVLQAYSSKITGKKITHGYLCLFGPLKKIP